MKLRVGVLMGGKSVEKEVSFNSGRTICDHLDTSRYEIIPLFQRFDGALFLLPWHFLHRGKISDFEHRLEIEAQQLTWESLKQTIDFVYIATHGRYAEDGSLQGFLEILGIPYLGSKVLASALRMDKLVQKNVLKVHGVDVAQGIHVTPDQIENFETHKETIIAELARKNITAPYIVKPHKEGSSIGISCALNNDELYLALTKACFINPEQPQTVLIEEKLQGMEFSCITLSDYTRNTFMPLPPTEIVPEPMTHLYDYEQKYMPGRSIKFTPARCSQEAIALIQKTCIRVMEILELTNLSRIDGFVTPDNRIVIIDANSLSGMGPASFIFRQAAELNMSHTQLINHLIETELHSYGMLDSIITNERNGAITMDTPKMRVAVLLGGRSNEKEISLESGRNVVYKLSPTNYEVIPLFVTSSLELYHIDQKLLVRNSTKEIEQDLGSSTRIAWDQLPTLVDFVFNALHGGEGENGCVQGTLDMLGVAYNGSGVLTSALCMDKHKTAEYLRDQGFDTPEQYMIAAHDWHNQETTLTKLYTRIAFPMIVKPHDDGCSVMVSKAHNQDELIQAITTIFEHGKTHALIEEYIIGMELTVGVLGNENARALVPSKAVAAAGILSIEEKFLPGAGENQTPAPISPQATLFVQRTIEQVFTAVGCKGYARIDCFYQHADQSPTKKERVIILEINTLPGLTPATCIFHQAAENGIRPMDFIDTIIKLGLQEHAHNKLHIHKEIGLQPPTR